MRSSRNDVAMDTPSRRNGFLVAGRIEVSSRHAVTGSRAVGPGIVEPAAVQPSVQHVEAHVEVLRDVPLRTGADNPVAAVEIAAASPTQRRRAAGNKARGAQGGVEIVGA